MASIFSHRSHAALCAVLALCAVGSVQAEPADVTPFGDLAENVKLNAWVFPGLRPDDRISMKINLTAPDAKRVCISYAGFETVGLVDRQDRRFLGNRGRLGWDRSKHKCIEQIGQAGENPLKDTVSLVRRDVPGETALMRPDFENLEETKQARAEAFQDGYVIVIATLDGKPAVFKVQSRFFALGTVHLKKGFMGVPVGN